MESAARDKNLQIGAPTRCTFSTAACAAAQTCCDFGGQNWPAASSLCCCASLRCGVWFRPCGVPLARLSTSADQTPCYSRLLPSVVLHRPERGPHVAFSSRPPLTQTRTFVRPKNAPPRRWPRSRRLRRPAFTPRHARLGLAAHHSLAAGHEKQGLCPASANVCKSKSKGGMIQRDGTCCY